MVWVPPASNPSALAMASRGFPKTELSDFLGNRPASEGAWAVSVMDLASRQTVYEFQGQAPLLPASTAKLLTTAFVLDVLGPDAVFRTQIYGQMRPGVDGILRGPLTLVGAGDPNLSSRVFPYEQTTERGTLSEPFDQLAAQLWQSGVRVVPDGIVADALRYPQEPRPAGWTEDDKRRWYGAPVRGLSFNDSLVFVNARPTRPGRPAVVSVQPNPAGLIRTAVTTGRRGSGSWLNLEAEGDHWVLKGQLAAGRGAVFRMLAQPEPAQMAAMALRDALERHGILVGSSTRILFRQPGTPAPVATRYNDQVLLAERVSPRLADAVTVVNKVSQNQHAEMLLREASLGMGGDGSLEMASTQLHHWLEKRGLSTPECFMDDACGLSRNNRLTATALTRVLGYAANTPWGKAWRQSLPLAGNDGTLRHRMQGLTSGAEVRAKTGTLNGVQTLAGFIRKPDGREYAFSILVNDFRTSDLLIRQHIDHLVDLIAGSPVLPQPGEFASFGEAE
ncbi:D-alanyl-D-alanine carboxypeptidase/D-alanyl-D-alanine endopeptidase [Thermithiobacillus plumbiphilus]|uniref:D-alanyl-D-alanine carboxypeptidase/D-alanyl-D-alanine-endopeptidase n=1 Tax=Thermithiobacillus plumbiphilus TaxID=1729899 RepID=A0ABU9D3X5_9PROT